MKRCILLLLLLAPLLASAQPTIQSVTPFASNVALTTYTTGNVTVATGTNLGMAICITNNENSTTESPVITAAPTFSLGGGQAFTKIVASGEAGQPTFTDYATLWYLVNPTVGTGTISWTHTNAQASSSATIFVLSGAAQSNPTVQGAHPAGALDAEGGPWSIGLTSTVDNSLMLMCAMHSNGGIEFTPGAGQTEQSDATSTGQRHTTSTEVKAVAGLETLTEAAATGAPAGRSVAMAIAPFVAASARRRVTPLVFQ